MLDLDVVALQASVVRLGPDRFVDTGIRKFGLQRFLAIAPHSLKEVVPGTVNASLSLVESLLQMLCVRWRPRLAAGGSLAESCALSRRTRVSLGY